MPLDPSKLNNDGIALYRLAESLRGEVLYMHESGDVSDSIRNSGGMLEEALDILGPIPTE